MDFQGFGRIVIVLGVLLLVAGGIMLLLGRAGLGSLPGNVRIQGQGWSCYVPILGSIVLSIILTLLLNLLIRFFR